MNRSSVQEERVKATEPPAPAYDPSGLSEALDRALAVMVAQLSFPPEIDGAFIATWEAELRRDKVQACDLAEAVRQALRADERFPRLARFLFYCARAKDVRHWEWRREYYKALDEQAAATPPMSQAERKALVEAIAARMSPGAKALFLPLVKEGA